MECRSLVLSRISAAGLTSVTYDKVYVVVHGTGGNELHTSPYLKGSSEVLTWNFPVNFTIDVAEGLNDGLHIVIKIMAENWLTRKPVGRISVSVNDLMEGITEEGKARERIRYPVVNRLNAKTGASLTFSYEFGRQFLRRAEAPSTTSGSNLLQRSLEFGELLTAVADNSAQGRGGGECGGGDCGGVGGGGVCGGGDGDGGSGGGGCGGYY